jgi:hypothetical protein
MKTDGIVRVACAIAITLAAVLFALMFAALCVEAVRRHELSKHELGLPIALAIVGLLTLFSTHISWKLWRGRVSPNGVTIMPTWFIQSFGLFYLAGILFVAYHRPTYPFLIEGVCVAYCMIHFGRHIAERKREHDRFS